MKRHKVEILFLDDLTDSKHAMQARPVSPAQDEEMPTVPDVRQVYYP
jgi:hypothetical protein